jgi:hypothetical protein
MQSRLAWKAVLRARRKMSTAGESTNRGSRYAMPCGDDIGFVIRKQILGQNAPALDGGV